MCKKHLFEQGWRRTMNTGKPSFFQAYIICCTPSLNNSVYSTKKMMKMMKTMNNKEQFTIKEDPRTCGFYAFFTHDGIEFYADLCLAPEGFNECMIFLSDNEQVVSWHELYCKGISPSQKNPWRSASGSLSRITTEAWND